MYLWYSEAPPPVPLGVFDRPSDVPGVSSVPVGQGDVARLLRKGTALYKTLGDLVPGIAWKWLK